MGEAGTVSVALAGGAAAVWRAPSVGICKDLHDSVSLPS